MSSLHRRACIFGVVAAAIATGQANGQFLVIPEPAGAESLDLSLVLSGSGEVVMGTASFPSQPRKRLFRWVIGEASSTDLGSAPGIHWVHGIDHAGDRAAGITGGFTTWRGWHWSATSGAAELPSPAGSSQYYAHGVARDGSSIVGEARLSSTEKLAVRWVAAGEPEVLPNVPGVTTTAAHLVSADGSIVGVSGQGGASEPATLVRWPAAGGSPTVFAEFPLNRSPYVRGDSADGGVLVGSQQVMSGFVHEPWRWTTDGGRETLSMLPGMTAGEAAGISADGSLIVGMNATEVGGEYADQVAVVWDAADGGGVRTLASYLTERGVEVPPGWVLESATGISADGAVIAGFGRDAGHDYRGFVVIVPGPGSGLGVAVGIGLLGRRRRRPALA